MAYIHNYIPYNYDIMLIHKVHALTYPFPHKSSHSLQTISYTQHMDVFGPSHTNWDCFFFFTVPKQSKWAIRGQPNHQTLVPLFENQFPWPFPASYTPTHNLLHKLQHKHPKQSLKLSRTVQMGLKNSNIFVPRFGTDQTATHALKPTQLSTKHLN